MRVRQIIAFTPNFLYARSIAQIRGRVVNTYRSRGTNGTNKFLTVVPYCSSAEC